MNYIKILLDSTYILPSFGIEVEGLGEEDIIKLKIAGIEGKVKFYCLSVTWIEIIGKVHRMVEKYKVDVKDIIDSAVKSLLESGFYEWITPSSQAVLMAFKLRMLGHRDNIDNLLYASSLENKMIFLTMDKNLVEFLKEHGYSIENVMDHQKLFKKLY